MHSSRRVSDPGNENYRDSLLQISCANVYYSPLSLSFVQLKHCAGSPNNGICSNNPLINCFQSSMGQCHSLLLSYLPQTNYYLSDVLGPGPSGNPATKAPTNANVATTKAPSTALTASSKAPTSAPVDPEARCVDEVYFLPLTTTSPTRHAKHATE